MVSGSGEVTTKHLNRFDAVALVDEMVSGSGEVTTVGLSIPVFLPQLMKWSLVPER